jgi:hypothetical protein
MTENISNLKYALGLFNSMEWLRVLEKSYGLDLRNQNTNYLGIPYCVVDNLLGKKISILPFCDYSENNLSEDQTVEFLNHLKIEFPDFTIVFKHVGHGLGHRFKSAKIVRQAVRHVVRLDQPIKYSSSFKRNSNKSEREGVIFRKSDGQQGIEDFYSLYCKLRQQKFNSIPQPKEFFSHIHDQFMKRDKGFFAEAVYYNQVIASLVVLQHENIWYYKFGASQERYLHLRPNNLVFKKLIEMGREQKIEQLDLGLSGASRNYAGLRRFKSSMGGVEEPVTYVD